MGINSASLLFKKVFAGKASSDNTIPFFSEPSVTNARLSVFSGDVWSEAHLIPDSGIGDITGSVSPGGFTSSGVVKYYSASGFSYIPGTSAGFSSSVKDWIPFNFGDGTTYSYKLLSNNGTQIPSSDDSSWTFDTEAGVLIFHEGFPVDNFGNELVNDTTLMPSMSAYAYIGKKLKNSGFISSSAQFSEIADFQSFSSSFSQSVVNFNVTSESMASEIADFQSFSSSFSQSVVDFQSFSSSFSQSVVDFTTTSESMASEIADFQSFSSSFSQSVVDFNTFSGSIEESISTKSITASSGIFFKSSSSNKKYRIDFEKIYSASSNQLELSSGSLTITASGVQVLGDLDASGSVSLEGALHFNGFNFTETSIDNITGSQNFGSGGLPSLNHRFTGSVLITGSNLTLVGGTLTIPNNAGDGTINVANALANTATATNVVTNAVFNAFSQSYSQSVVDFTTTSESMASEIVDFQSFSSSFSESVVNFNTTSESIASEIVDFQSFSSSFSESVVNFNTTSESIASEIVDFQSFSSSFSQSVVDFTLASQSIAGEITSFKSFSSSFSESVVNFNTTSQSIAGEITSFKSFSSSFSQSVVNFTTTSESIASEIVDFQSFSSSFSQSVVDFITTSESIASEIVDFQSFSSSFSQSVVDFATTSESIASEIADFQSFSSSFSQSVVDFNTFSGSIETSLTTGDITASGNISASGFLFFSSSETNASNHKILVQDPNTGQVFTTGSIGGSGGGGNGTQITLGADTTGNLPLIASTTIQNSIDQINSVLDLLAPTVPSSLSAVSLGFFGTTNYSAIDKDGNTVSSVTNDTSPSFITSTEFFDGDNGVLSAQHFPSSSGAIGTGYNSNFPSSSISLTTGNDTGTNGILQIVSDTDPYVGQAGSANFYKVLSAKINLSGLTANNVGDYQRNTVRLIHTQTGPNGIDKEFTIDSDPASSVTDLNFTYNETNNFHYQSGIKYLGNDDNISAHYNVTINSNANFINTSGRIAQIADNPDVFSSPYKTTSSCDPGRSFNVTHSLDVNDGKFNTGNVTLYGRNFKASSTTFATNQTNITISNLLIDSKTENEITPTSGVTRVKSGNGQYPSSGSSVGNFIGTFSSASSLTTSNEYELQFSNQYYHWPASTNYTDYIPSGPNYSSISGDSSNNSLRYATFNLGTITTQSSATLTFEDTCGFDNATIQTSDNFQLHLIVVNEGVPVTNWINGNAAFSGAGNTIEQNGVGGLNPTGNVSSAGVNRDFIRIITFGDVTVTGTVYVRVGWSVSGGTSPTGTSTRKFKHITKS